MTGVSGPVVAARAPDLGLADRRKALVLPGPAATDVREPPALAPPYCGPTPRPVLHGFGRTVVTPHLALADVGGIQDSTPPVFGATPGLDVADSGGALSLDLGPCGGTPGLPPAVDRVIPGMSPAEVWGIPGRVAAHPEETRAPSFLLGSTQTPQGPVSPAKQRWEDRWIQALGLPAAGCASAVYPWPNLKLSGIRDHVRRLGQLALCYDVTSATLVPGRSGYCQGSHVGDGQRGGVGGPRGWASYARAQSAVVHLLGIDERTKPRLRSRFTFPAVSWGKESAGKGRGTHFLEKRGLRKDPWSP